MKKKSIHLVILLFVALYLGGCAASSQINRKELGNLQTAVEASASAVIGEYPDTIPGDFDAVKFIDLVNGKIPPAYFSAIKEYPLDVRSLGEYYRLVIYSKSGQKKVLIFDYSCTPNADGPVYLDNGKFDLDHIEKYDPCKKEAP